MRFWGVTFFFWLLYFYLWEVGYRGVGRILRGKYLFFCFVLEVGSDVDFGVRYFFFGFELLCV